MRRSVVPLAVLLVLGTFSAAEASDSWSSLKKALVRAVKGQASIDDTVEHARKVIADGKPRASKLMCDVLDDVVDREWENRADATEAAAAIYKGRWSSEAHKEMDRLVGRADLDRELGMRLADELAKAPDSFREALVVAARKRKDGRLHAVAVRMMANLPKDSLAISYVLEVVVGAEDARIRLAAMRALEVEAEVWGSIIADRISDSDWTVQVDAARLAAKHGLGAAIGDMIGGMSCATPRVQHAFVSSLQSMTGQPIGLRPDSWKFWWDANKKRFGNDVRPAKGGNCRQTRYVPFYDLEIHSNRVLFVVDVSGSMRNMATEYIGEDGRAHESTEFTRMQLVKNQLSRAITGLPDGTTFNLVTFGGEVSQWRDAMTVADTKSRKSAIRWIKKLRPDGSTQLNGAMHAVFGGMGFGDATVAPVDVDTMVVLSDGAPTDGWPDGRGPSGRMVVLEEVNRWNRDRSIVIHTVALKGAAVDFLKALAEDNGGQCSIR